MAGEAGLTIAECLALDDEELLEALGGELLGHGPGFGAADFERHRNFAKAWLAERETELRDLLCGDTWRRLRRGGGTDALEDAAAIADALAAMHGHPPVNIVAVIVLRRGLDRLCDRP